MIKKIYLDMDGVIADFESRFVSLYGEEAFYNDRSRKNFSTNWTDFVTSEQFKTLDWFPGGKELINYLNLLKEKYGIETEILSSSGGPKYHKLVKEQKIAWLESRGIDYKPNIVPGKSLKAQYATEDSVLIDDTPVVLEKFGDAGGKVILHTNFEETVNKLKTLVPVN